MTDHHHKVFNPNDYIPKRFGLNYSPPQIIIEYLSPSTGKLYHHKMRLHKFTKDKSNAEVMKELYEKHQVYLDKKKVSSEQILRLIERLKQNFVPRKKKTENKKPEMKKEEKKQEEKKEINKKEEIKEIKKEEKKEEVKKADKSDDIEEDFDFGEIEESEKSKEEKKKEEVKPKEPEKKDEKKKNKIDDELEEEEEEYGFDEFEDEDLNKLNDSELNKKKAEMDIEFEKNNIKKGDAKFQYDIRKEFDHEQYAAEWDDDSY